LKSADEEMMAFNAPDMSGVSAFIGPHVLHLTTIKQSTEKLIHEVTSEMDRLLFHNPTFTISDSDIFYDEPRSRTPGYGFVNDTRNSWTSRKTVLEHILSDPLLFPQFGYLNKRNEVVWLPGTCHQRMRDIFNLQMKLWILILFMAGEPACGTEFLALLFVNIAGGSIRNIFFMFQFLFMRGSYNKTNHVTGSDKTMVRVPLPVVGRLVAQFLIFLHPLYMEWQLVFRPHMHHNASHFLLAGLHRLLATTDLLLELSKYTFTEFGIKLSLGKYRKFMVFITKCNRDIFNDVQLPTSATQEQIGHTGTIEHNNYNGDERLPDGLDCSTFMRTARVSAVMHILLRHEPTLLALLEVGNTCRVQISHLIKYNIKILHGGHVTTIDH
jgi:hypothetical protein